MRKNHGLSILLIVFSAVTVMAKWQADQSFRWRFPALTDLIVSESYLQDIAALLLGARRAGANLAYIQFLQYYGDPRNAGETAHDHSHAEGGDEHEDDYAGGVYKLLKDKGLRLMRLDPFFNVAILEVAGALAFNQKRTDEALTILREAIRMDPSFARYHLYVTAILYKNKGDDLGLIGVLQETIRQGDYPPMVPLVLGNLLKKNGRYLEAAQMYVHVIKTAANPADQQNALRRLDGLLREHPEVGPQLRQSLE